MLKLVVNNKEEEELAPAPLRIKPAGKGPGGWDWLSPMLSGTEFNCKHKQLNPWLLQNFTHGGKKEGDVLLIPTATMNNHSSWIWVDPVEFCKVFDLRAILSVPDD